jgi:ubiquitin C-terminal hydrolase
MIEGGDINLENLCNRAKSSNEEEKQSINLDDCIKQFNMEELLVGNNQVYCRNCKEH